MNKPMYKTYSFWLGLSSAVLLLIQAIGEPLGLKINEAQYMAIVNAVLGVFVVLGIISNPESKIDNNQDNNKDKQE